MSTYAIGDIQGCYDTLQALLDYVDFDPAHDKLWLVGDLVNRGPKSLEVLRFVRDLGDRVVCVLGNHDIRLLLRSAGVTRRKKRDTFHTVLEADDRDELLDWLRNRPVMHVEDDMVLVHAGLHPAWSMEQAQAQAGEIADLLRGDDWRERIAVLLSRKPPAWSPDLEPTARIRAAAAVFFRIRTCRADGTLCNEFAGPMQDAPDGCIPWFMFESPKWQNDHEVLFGHWSALGLLQKQFVTCLDTGCVWGGALTAMRLEDGEIFQVPAVENRYYRVSSVV